MCPVRIVTYVSGRSVLACPLIRNSVSDLPQQLPRIVDTAPSR